MKLAILSRNSKLYSTRRLVEAARGQGHSVRVLDPLRCYMRIANDGFGMRFPMLLGRTALAGMFVVDPLASFIHRRKPRGTIAAPDAHR